jgi:hypothetical protein
MANAPTTVMAQRVRATRYSARLNGRFEHAVA